MYQTEIVNIGEMVEEFKSQNLIILFGPKATPELKEISVMHDMEVKPNKNLLKVGGKIIINDKKYQINFVGDVANENFYELGHVSIYFNENKEDEILPGAISVSPAELPKFNIGDKIVFED
ncbi:PTS glucitol/sorbitol transporter subunit IIA [Ignavigranum ruoffiae]|uniref:PTS glucitol/sorbitol transporter subunit IIA n=1 Tax=Ignavigranum ruoffiae TaxID=89093 RepID=UPI00235354CD|nr:PTS glucitol/sorbitol transporter subunit IIA [Ignavigranum ruoffiae]